MKVSHQFPFGCVVLSSTRLPDVVHHDLYVSPFPARHALDVVLNLRLSADVSASARRQLAALGVRSIEIPVDGRSLDGGSR